MFLTWFFFNVYNLTVVECTTRTTQREQSRPALSTGIKKFPLALFSKREWFIHLEFVCENHQVQAELLTTYVQPYDDVRAFTFKAIKSYAARPVAEWLGEIYSTAPASTPTSNPVSGQPTRTAATAPTSATTATDPATTSLSSVTVPTEAAAVAAFCRHAIAALAQLTVPSSRDLVATKFFGNPDATEADTSSAASSSSSLAAAAAGTAPVSVSRVHRGGVGNIVQQRRWHAEAWLAILRLPLPVDVYKTVLLQVPTHVLPCLALASGVGAATAGGAASTGMHESCMAHTIPSQVCQLFSNYIEFFRDERTQCRC
jgi:hypothetical protein